MFLISRSGPPRCVGTRGRASKGVTLLLLLCILYYNITCDQTQERIFQQVKSLYSSPDSDVKMESLTLSRGLRKKQLRMEGNIFHVIQEDSTDYTLWSKSETYFETCRKHYIGNHSWGQPLTKFVDKAHVKSLVEAMGIKGLKIPRTLALYNKNNISEFTVEKMRQIPQPYIIKPTHISGGVSRVRNDWYTCIKDCDPNEYRALPIGKIALDIILEKSEADLGRIFSEEHNEPQYKDIPHQIIVEEDVQVGDVQTDVSYWYAANGQPLFVSIQCSPTSEGELGIEKERAFVNMNFHQLNLQLSMPPCHGGLVRPSNWAKQVEVATSLAKHMHGILRIDLYAGEKDIFFSEFTYTTSYCRPGLSFRPRVADGLLHAVQYGVIDPTMATPKLVESIIHDKSWVFLTLLNGRTIHPESSRSFPSPVDLCEYVNNNPIHMSKYQKSNDDVKYCLAKTKEVAFNELRCIIGSGNNSSLNLNVLSDKLRPTFWAVMAHVDWGRAITLVFAIAIMTRMEIGTKRQKNQHVNNVLYLVVMLVVLRLTLPRVEATFSEHSVLDIVKQSFEAFAYVHPMSSPHIALSHFATYWFEIAAWRSKSLRNLLIWQLLFETVTAAVNEYSHLIEHQEIVHCTRVAFKESAKLYAFDNLIREYIVSPFFVYGYLLPKFIVDWAKDKELLLWAGIISSLAFAGYSHQRMWTRAKARQE